MNTQKNTRWMHSARFFLFVAALSGALIMFQAVPAWANDNQEATQIIDKACMTFNNFMNDDNMGLFRDLLKKAKAVVIAPSLLKGAFIVGASGGNAVAVTLDEKSGEWSKPAFFAIGGASFGLQIGGQASEVILLAMTERGANSLMTNSFKLGVDAGIAAGPVGIGAQAATANLSADIVSFSRSKGLYGGVSLDGAVIAVRGTLNEAFYGRKVSSADILARHEAVENPRTACLEGGLMKFSEETMTSRR